METNTLPVPAIQSDAIDKLSVALAAAQAELTNPPKTKTVHAGKQTYSFAPLPEILDAVRPVLKKHGLAVVQMPRESVLETRLIHTSGQWLGAAYRLPSISDSQAMGSAITYARRYSLCAMLGIAAEDDEDANAATEAEHAEDEEKKAKAVAALEALKKAAQEGRLKSAHDGRTLKPGESAESPADPSPPPKSEPLSGLAPELAALMRKHGITRENLKAYYVGKGHMPESVDPEKLPADYVKGLTSTSNWTKAVAAMKGAK